MKAADYLREKRRMCNSFNYCSDCPFKDTSCNETENNNPEKAEAIVEQWALDHPVIYNSSKFREVFGIFATEVKNMDESKFRKWLGKEYEYPKGE